MPSDLQVSNIKDLTGSNTGLSIASDGQVSITQNNPTIQLGSNTTFPSGHIIKKSVLLNSDSGNIVTSSTTATSLISVDYTTLLNSSSSLLEIVFYASHTTIGSGYGNQYIYITATKSSHTTTYSVNNLIRLNPNSSPNAQQTTRRNMPNTGSHRVEQTTIQLFGADPYPNTMNLTSYAAGDVIRFQFYGVTTNASGDCTLALNDFWRSLWVNEYKL